MKLVYCTYLSDDSLPGSLFGADMTLGTGVYPSQVQTGQAGYYLALKPLSFGQHTLRFGAEMPLLAPDGTNYGTFTQDVAYNINVVPEPVLIMFGATAFLPLAGLVLARRRRTLRK